MSAPTPRTDEAERAWLKDGSPDAWAFARELERELAEEKAHADKLAAMIRELTDRSPEISECRAFNRADDLLAAHRDRRAATKA